MNRTMFDFESFKKQATGRLKVGDTVFARDGVLTPVLKESIEEL